MRLYKDNSSGELGLCIRFISFTKRLMERENREIESRERKKKEIQEEQSLGRKIEEQIEALA